MSCPDCGTKYVCPCKSCRERHPEATPWIWSEPDMESCSGCGLTQAAYQWMDIAMEQMKATGNWPDHVATEGGKR